MDSPIIDRIDSLPPLPRTIIEIEEYRQAKKREIDELLVIINKDAPLVSTLLKVANSAIFSFRSRIETVSKAVNMLGTEFTISIAISSALQNILKANLSPYGIHSNDFMRSSNLASKLALSWLKGAERNELVLPAFLQQTGMFVLAEEIEDSKQTKLFQAMIHKYKSVAKAEKDLLGVTSAQITAQIFKKWNICGNFIQILECVDSVEKCDKKDLRYVQILNVLKTVCEVTDPFSDENIEKGLELSTQYNLDTVALKKAIVKIQDNLLDEN